MNSTTPYPSAADHFPTADVLAAEVHLDQWKGADTRRQGVMARQGYRAGFAAGLAHARRAVYLVVHDTDGVYGVYATKQLAEQHRAHMSRPDEFTIEEDVIHTDLMPVLTEAIAS